MTKRKVRTSIQPGEELEVDQAELSRLHELGLVVTTPRDAGPARLLEASGSGAELAVRAAAPMRAGALGLGATHDIQTTMRPDQTITVGDAEYQQLLAEGLVYSGSPQSPAADSYDMLFADKVQHGTATPAALRAAYVPPTARGARIVWLGDSITQGATDNANQSLGQSYPLMAQLALAGRGLTVRNAGIAGNTSAQILARFDADVTPYAPNVVPLLAGTNDIGNAVPFATFQANMQGLVAKIRALGATPVLCTIPPNNDDARQAAIATWNLWLTRYAAAIGAPLIDLHAVLVDPVTGRYQSGWTDDGTHPNLPAQRAMGAAAAAVLSQFLNPWSVPLVQSNADPVQLLGANPLLTADSDSDGVPDQWVSYGGGATVSLVTDSQVLGKMVRVSRTAGTSVQVIERGIGIGFAVGDRLSFAGIITSDGGVNVDLKLDFIGASASGFAGRFQGAVTRGVWYQEFTVPTGTTSINFDVIVGSGTGVVSFGQPSLYNLTALGLA